MCCVQSPRTRACAAPTHLKYMSAEPLSIFSSNALLPPAPGWLPRPPAPCVHPLPTPSTPHPACPAPASSPPPAPLPPLPSRARFRLRGGPWLPLAALGPAAVPPARGADGWEGACAVRLGMHFQRTLPACGAWKHSRATAQHAPLPWDAPKAPLRRSSNLSASSARWHFTATQPGPCACASKRSVHLCCMADGCWLNCRCCLIWGLLAGQDVRSAHTCPHLAAARPDEEHAG